MFQHRMKTACRLLAAALCALLLTALFACAADPAKQMPDTGSLSESSSLLEQFKTSRLGVVSGTTFEELTNEYYPEAEIVNFNTQPDMMMALKTGKIDGYLDEEPLGRLAVAEESTFKMLDGFVERSDYAFALPKNEDGDILKEQVNAYIEKLRTSGELQRLDDKWFGTNDAGKVMDDYAQLPNVNGVINVATCAEFEPFSYASFDHIVGYEIEILMDFCADNGYAMNVTDMQWGGMLSAMASGKYDIACACITATNERAEIMNFTEPDYSGGIVMVTDRSRALKRMLPYPYETATFGAVTGSMGEMYAQELFPGCQLRRFNNQPDMLLALESGKLDYVLAAEIEVLNSARNKGADYEYGSISISDNSVHIAAQKGQTTLLRRINQLLTTYWQDGTLEEMEARWIHRKDEKYVREAIPEVIEGPELVIATSGTSEPMSFILNDELVGYDVELGRRIAYDLGMKPVFEDMQFPAILSALQGGKADIAISYMAATEERRQSVDFSEPYYYSHNLIVWIKDRKVSTTAWWEKLAASIDKNFIREQRWKMVLRGMSVTVAISLISAILGTLLGFGVCMARMSKNRFARGAAAVYIEMLQGMPTVVLLMILYYVVFATSEIDGMWVAMLGFAMNFAAYFAELMRTGIESVDKGQKEAAQAIGFTRAEVFSKIIFPQAVKQIMPVYRGDFVNLVKNTSIVGYIAVQDITKVSDIIRSRTYEAFFPLILTAIIYFLLANLLVSLLKAVELRIDPKRRPRSLKGVNTGK